MQSLWNHKEAANCKDRLDLLVYSSRLIGAEPKLCVWGGGNTSTKDVCRDHLGRMRRVLYIKGSGSDLKASVRRDYPPVALDDLLEALKKEAMTDEEMVDFVSKCLLEPKAPRPSIEVLLHAFVDQPDIHHTHADAILSITNTRHGKKWAQDIFGDQLLWIPYVKPGFTLSKRMAEAYQQNPGAKGAILEKHGLITWGADAWTSYHLTIEMVSRAEKALAAARRKKVWSKAAFKSLSAPSKKECLLRFLPVIRQAVSRQKAVLLHVDDSPEVMEFVNAKDTSVISQKGPATPDHMLRTKRVPLYVKVPAAGAAKLSEKRLEKQIEDYAIRHQKYFERHLHSLPKGTTMLDPYPKVILIPEVGMITTGSDLKNAQMISEIYRHSIEVMKNASALDAYESLSEKLAFEMDYWPMELYKLSLAPQEASFSRKIGLVTGAARGIGKAAAKKLAAGGAHVFLFDIDAAAVDEASREINESLKTRRVFPLRVDVTNPQEIKSGLEKILLTLGGLDFVVSNAGIARVAPIENLELSDWQKSFDVNATGHFLIAREAVRLMRRQGMGGSIVFIVTKNVPAPGKDFGAYSASKAAQAQLAKVLAIENGEAGIRVNMINPDGVFEDSGLWAQIGPERARSYGIAPEKLESFYQNRNLMKIRVLPEDVAEAAAFLISAQASKTTGCILTVDGGVKEAFLR